MKEALWSDRTIGGDPDCIHVWETPLWEHPVGVVGGKHIDRQCRLCAAYQCGVTYEQRLENSEAV